MTVMDILHKWDDWNIPLIINDDALREIAKFDMISDFAFENDKEIYDHLKNRKVIAMCVYDGELCIRVSDYDTIPYERAIEIASMSIDGLREDDEQTAQEYLLKEVCIKDDFEREFFGLGKIEEDNYDFC